MIHVGLAVKGTETISCIMSELEVNFQFCAMAAVVLILTGPFSTSKIHLQEENGSAEQMLKDQVLNFKQYYLLMLFCPKTALHS